MVKTILLHLDEGQHEKLMKIKGDLSWDKFFLENQEKDWEALHTNIHACRLIKSYKPSEMEIRLGSIVVDRFKNVCDECKKVAEKLKGQAVENKKKGFWDILSS